MGEIAKRRKKGRPPKADLARRSAAAAAEPLGSDLRRSLRPRSHRQSFDLDDYVEDEDDEDGDDEDGAEERTREKRLSLVLQVQNDDGGAESPPPPPPSMKRRRTDGGNEIERDDDEDDEVRVPNEDIKEAYYISGPRLDSSQGFPLPDKKSLELILDKLQKKDKYNVYAEPVDPEELPDYYDVIEHPMDFATVRKKLTNGLYSTLEQFEDDVFLICTNAMQYNSPSTMYYRQARSIQELARNKFQRIRTDFGNSGKDLNSEQKTRFGSVAENQIKKPMSGIAPELLGSDFSSGATLATVGDFQNNLPIQASGCERPCNVDGILDRNSSVIDNNLDNGEDLLSGKGISLKFGRKPLIHKENRRSTYNISNHPSVGSESLFTMFDDEMKQLVAVGLHADHSYSRSLARFSATLGPLAWKVASRRITQVLPPDYKFGRGWVGEYEPLPKPVFTLEKCTPKDLTSFTKMNSTPAKEQGISEVDMEENPTYLWSANADCQQKNPKSGHSEPEKNVYLSSANADCWQKNPKSGHSEPEKKVLELAELNSRRAGSVAETEILNGSEMPVWRSSEAISRNDNLLQSKQRDSNGVHVGGPLNGKCISLDTNVMGRLVSSDPVQSMTILAENGIRHQKSTGAREFNPARDNTRKFKNHIFADTLHNPNKEPQPQVIRFSATSDVKPVQPDKNSPPLQTFAGPPVRPGNEAQFHNVPMVFPRSVSADSSRFQVESHWQSINAQTHPRHKQDSLPPDLNMLFKSTGSPVKQSSGKIVDSQHPDLALQL